MLLKSTWLQKNGSEMARVRCVCVCSRWNRKMESNNNQTGKSKQFINHFNIIFTISFRITHNWSIWCVWAYVHFFHLSHLHDNDYEPFISLTEWAKMGIEFYRYFIYVCIWWIFDILFECICILYMLDDLSHYMTNKC